MKSKFEFHLENAGWPALLVEETGSIRAYSQCSPSVFGSVLEGDSPLFFNLWAAENSVSAEQFLVRLERSDSAGIQVFLRIKGGRIVRFKMFASNMIRDGHRFYIMQLFPESAPISANKLSSPPIPLPPPVEVAQKQTPPTVGATSPEVAAKPPTPPVVSTSVDMSTAQKQKLDCAMQLIRSVVLDFNNALTSILGHASLLLSKLEPNHPWKGSLMEVEKSAERAAEIVNDLAAFSLQEKDPRSRAATNLNDLLRRTVELFQTPGGPNILWTTQLESKLYATRFDEAKMQQAFVKILENAVQAIKADARIAVRTRNVDLDGSQKDAPANLMPGSYVCVEVQDNGTGIANDILPRIFEPFFTTKPNHRGLGLAWVYGIVTNHGGSVVVTSTAMIGTTVRTYLPAEKRIIKDRTFNNSDLKGTQTILLVDDETLMLNMGETVLTSFGYQVLTASNGETALKIVLDKGDRIDLIITDLVMPGMSGRQLIEKVHEIYPHMPIICSSGYVRPSKNEDEDLYLRKPFTAQQLLQKVKHVLS